MSAEAVEEVPEEVPEPGAEIACGCCQTKYSDDNDIVLFGVLRDCNGRVWPVCGPCIQVMWQARAPRFDADPQPV